MSYISIFIISFTIALSGALAPGPLLAVVIYEGAKRGFKSGPLIILGHSLLEIIMIAIIIFGLSSFINNPIILKIIFFVGAFILFAFGTKMLASVKHISLNIKDSYKKSSNLVLTGITMSLANPYWTIWWLTIGLGLLLLAKKQGFIAIAIFFIGHILADFLWYSIVSFTISKGRKFISEKIYKSVVFICGLTLIGFGIYFAISSF